MSEFRNLLRTSGFFWEWVFLPPLKNISMFGYISSTLGRSSLSRPLELTTIVTLTPISCISALKPNTHSNTVECRHFMLFKVLVRHLLVSLQNGSRMLGGFQKTRYNAPPPKKKSSRIIFPYHTVSFSCYVNEMWLVQLNANRFGWQSYRASELQIRPETQQRSCQWWACAHQPCN